MREIGPHVFHHPAGYAEFVHMSVAGSKKMRVITQAFLRDGNNTVTSIPFYWVKQVSRTAWIQEAGRSCKVTLERAWILKSEEFQLLLQSVYYRWKGYERKCGHEDLVSFT